LTFFFFVCIVTKTSWHSDISEEENDASPHVALRLTTIEVPAFDIGYESLYCLKRLLSGAPMEQCRVVLPVANLISGESTAPPPVQK
jgi:hypothetical protein